MSLALIVAACSGAGGAATTTATPVDCAEPPEEQVEAISPVEMTLEPSPVMSRQVAQLVVAGARFPEEATISVDARWQCWDGSDWVTTHIVYRGFGDDQGETIPVNPNFQIQVPDIALWLDHEYAIGIPQVEPGTYRIEDEVLAEGDAVIGFVIVEVIAG